MSVCVLFLLCSVLILQKTRDWSGREREKEMEKHGETIDIMLNILKVNQKTGQSTSSHGVGSDSEGVME